MNSGCLEFLHWTAKINPHVDHETKVKRKTASERQTDRESL